MTTRPRRSALYMPGSNARALEKAKTLAADAIIIDLEDSIAPDKKHEARTAATTAIKAGGYGRREILLRTSPLRPGRWLFFLVTCVCLSISALYELIEWWAALLSADGAAAFLGTQGDVWDTQWDMLLALCGAVAAQLSLARAQDRELAKLAPATRS